jgi:hypothetical protein
MLPVKRVYILLYHVQGVAQNIYRQVMNGKFHFDELSYILQFLPKEWVNPKTWGIVGSFVYYYHFSWIFQQSTR